MNIKFLKAFKGDSILLLNEIQITLSESRSPVRNNFSKIIQFNDKDYIFDFYSENRPYIENPFSICCLM